VSAATLTRTPTAEENDAVVQALLAERDPFFAMLLDRVERDYACGQCGQPGSKTEAKAVTAARTAQT
jgi:Na+-translocating ferredoxin:NAD+ oxidoreductase RNF subunit RnfB